MEPSSGPIHVFLSLSLFGLDISITSAVLIIWIAAAIILILSFIAARRPSLIPGKIQNIIEIIYEFFEGQIKEIGGDHAKKWTPFIFSIFCFILVCNLLSLIPNVYPITANINVTVTLAAMVFFTYHLAGMLSQGFVNYFRSFVPKGVPIYIMPLMLIIEIISQLARPFSLAIRLFANETAGHLVAFTILSLMFILNNIWLAGFPLLGRVIIGLFEVFVALIQAYIFAYLAALYIGLAVTEEA